MRIATLPLCALLTVRCTPTADTPAGPGAIDPPSISAPADGASVTSPLTVSGVALAGHRVTLVLTQNDATLVQTSAMSADDGAWSTTLRFVPRAGQLVLEVATVVNGQRSPPTHVDLTIDASADPSPLTITAPAHNTRVYGEVVIQGHAEPEAAVSAVAKTSQGVVGGAASVADPEGVYRLHLRYDDTVSANQTIQVEVTQTTEHGASAPATLDIVHGQAIRLTGTVSDLEDHKGSEVFVRAYRADADGFDFLAEHRSSVDDTTAFEGVPFSLDLPPGDYLIRAFRDGGGPDGATPDGAPTLGQDAQSRATEITVTDTSSPPSVELTLDPPATIASARFDVRTRNASATPYVPQGSTPGTGRGQCGGFYLQLEVDAPVSTGDPRPAPQVRLPAGNIVTLIDDGGCGDAADNTAGSYDHKAGDGRFSLGIPNPGPGLVGPFVYVQFDPSSGQLGVQTDVIDEIKRLSRRVVLIEPSGAEASLTVRPTLRWDPVEGAAGYRIDAEGPGPRLDGHFVTDNSWTVNADLEDGASYEVRLTAIDANPELGEDIDAEANGIANRFVVDTDDTHTVVIAGTVDTSRVQQNVPIRIEAGRHFSADSTLWLPATATSFNIVALRSTEPQAGYVEGILDVDGTGSRDGLNRTYRATADKLDLLSASVPPVLLTFVEPIRTLMPAFGAQLTTLQPNFTWAPYPDPPNEPWSWVFFVAPLENETEGPPPNLFGLPPPTTSYRLGQTMGVRDIGLLARCVSQQPDQFDETSWTCRLPVMPSATRLAPGAWRWGVVIVPCPFGAPSYAACMTDQLQGTPAIASAEVIFDVR